MAVMPRTETAPPVRGSSRRPTLRRLCLVFGPDAPRSWWLDSPRAVIGRDGEIRVADGQMSAQHAEISVVAGFGRAKIRDLDSKNGTHLAGERISEATVAPGVVIRMGACLFVLAELAVDARVDEERLRATSVALARAKAELIADAVAPHDLPVLIRGPTGAGKERIAARVHDASGRNPAFVTINCSTLSAAHGRSELFGHVKGAFTGAEAARAGAFVEADGGTLFLDEIAELSLDVQAMLLRALEDGAVVPLGADRPRAVDVRVVAASHEDLAQLVDAGRFRADLFARLGGAEIEIPALTARREEVLTLLDELSGAPVPLSVEAAEALVAYDWPRNVRELRHVAAALRMFGGEAPTVTLDHLPDAIRAHVPSSAAPAVRLEDMDRAGLEAVLKEAEGNVADAARALGVHRQRIYEALRAHGLSAASFRRNRARAREEDRR